MKNRMLLAGIVGAGLAAGFVSAQTPAQPAQGVEDLASMELEALVITAPRMKIKAPLALDPQINSNLLRLLRLRQNARPDSQAVLDASLGSLTKLTTPTAFMLRTRYTELGFLLTEGLAGATDMQIGSELENTVRQGTNVQIRAAAMVALAYTHDQRYVGLFQSALIDPNVTVRLGALESLMILGGPGVQMSVAGAARSDSSLTVQLYAAAGMWRLGDVYGREILLRLALHQDWFVRGLAIRYLGELGGADEYRKLLQWLPGEGHQAVRAELCSALLNLKKYSDN
ncbi:MAG: HEAT repeat domain-containing protein [Candidatus Methylomirabilota bacterium]